MGNPKAFLTVPRKEAGYRPIHDRIHDFGEVEQTLNTKDRQEQASRCMDCGVLLNQFLYLFHPLAFKTSAFDYILLCYGLNFAKDIMNKP